MNSNLGKKSIPILSYISLAASLILLGLYLYGNTHMNWANSTTMGIMGWLWLIAFAAGLLVIILPIALHIPDVKVYLILAVISIVISIFVGIPLLIGYGLAHTQIG